MAQDPFYHGLIRKYIVLFGSLFTDIYIERTDAEGDVQQNVKVPLSYGPKEWYLAQYYNNTDLERPINRVLPRMAFEIVSMQYDASRKLNTTNEIRKTNEFLGTMTRMPGPVPYNLHIRLSVITRNADDGTRIVEQIIPSFTPEITLTLNVVPDMDTTIDVPIYLGNVELDDNYEDDMRVGNRIVIWNLDFVMKVSLYGPFSRSEIIKDIRLNLFDDTTSLAKIIETIRIIPGLTANGNPTSSANNSIDLSQISEDDDYGFIVSFTGGATPVGTAEEPPWPDPTVNEYQAQLIMNGSGYTQFTYGLGYL
jgi:hypothetical protein